MGRVNDTIFSEGRGRRKSQEFLTSQKWNDIDFQPLNRSLTNTGVSSNFDFNQLRQPVNRHHWCLLLVMDLGRMTG